MPRPYLDRDFSSLRPKERSTGNPFVQDERSEPWMEEGQEYVDFVMNGINRDIAAAERRDRDLSNAQALLRAECHGLISLETGKVVYTPRGQMFKQRLGPLGFRRLVDALA